jgi:peptidoglycan/xylan/chitin deacetylase (PgdA/CDA1 family)
MWDIDTEDWRQPGADVIVSRVLTQVFPGAVILFHDGGGDRSQTVEALGRILESLSSQGYRFEAVCQ